MEVFNVNTDKVGFNELNEDVKRKINNASVLVEYNLKQHVDDKRVHITSNERDKWNAKAPNNSPNLTGIPTAPTPTVNEISNRIATTSFVSEFTRGLIPQNSLTANKLKTPVDVRIVGAVESTPIKFDGSSNLIMTTTSIDPSKMNGIIPTSNLSGTYNISISGTAKYAESAMSVAGITAADIVSSDSPKLKGNPTAPTAKLGDRSDQIATTRFVAKEIDDKLVNMEAKTAVKLKRPVTIHTTGKITADPLTFDGTSDVTFNVTALDIDMDYINNHVKVKTVNGYTIAKDVPADAKFTDTIYTHPNTTKDLSGTEYLITAVDRQGHVISGRNPELLNVNISKNAATATKLAQKVNISLAGVTATQAKFDGSDDVAINITSIPASLIAQTSDMCFITKEDKDRLQIGGLITSKEVDAKVEALKTELDWKETVDTVEELTESYPNAVKGWTVNVNSDGNTYRFDGKSWVNIMSNATLPMATNEVDGKMSKEDKAKLDSIEAGANKFIMPSTISADKITETNSRKFITTDEKNKLNSSYTRSEIDTVFATKQDLQKATARPENTVSFGEWSIRAENGSLVFLFNNQEKMKLDSNGKVTINEIDLGNTESITPEEARRRAEISATTSPDSGSTIA